MTLNQLQDLTDEELALALVIINDIAPPILPKMTFEPKHLTWFRQEQLIKKFLDVFQKLKPEGHSTYVSLMQKLGVCVQIQQPPPASTETNPQTIETATETTGSAGCSQATSIQPDVNTISGSDASGKST
jgi:hypothetical protein